MREPISWILFDWGNVLVRYRPVGFLNLGARLGRSVDEVVEVIRRGEGMERLETGAMSPGELSDLLDARFGTRLGRAEISACFADEVSELMEGAEALVAELAPRYRLGILSNTFFGHWDHLEATPFYRQFERRMASHMLGASKPERAIYQRALAEMGARAGEVAFVDDKVENVESARDLGIRAYRSVTIEQTRAGLRDLGVELDPSTLAVPTDTPAT